LNLEIERKFKLDRVPAELDGAWPRVTIEQGYLAIHEDGTEVRIRRKGGRRTLTVKSAGGLTRVEVELEIDADRFRSLWPLTTGRRVRKVRSTLKLADGLVAEIDVYEGDLDGLVVAEVEFETHVDGVCFEPPAWLGHEVTGDAGYLNRSLAIRGLPS